MSDHIQYFPTIHELLRHKDLKSTTVFTHVLNRSGQGVRSPADTILHDN